MRFKRGDLFRQTGPIAVLAERLFVVLNDDTGEIQKPVHVLCASGFDFWWRGYVVDHCERVKSLKKL